MLFPNLAPENIYRNDDDGEILSFMDKFYSNSISINQEYWSEADIDTRFEAGDQQLYNELYNITARDRSKNFNFNRIRRVINMVSGHQRRNRKSTIVVPIENADMETADQFTKIIMWANGRENVLETISEAFHGALVTGMSMLQVWVDYRTDPVSGNIRVDNCPYNTFMIDPYFKKADLSDCNGIWKRSYLSKREVVSLLPDKTDHILGMTSAQSGNDGKFQFMPEAINAVNSGLLAYDEFYYRSFRMQRLLVDAETGETMEWKGKNEDDLKEFLRTYPTVTVLEQQTPTVKLAIVVDNQVMYNGVNPLGIDKYPFVPVLGYFNPQISYYPLRIQGMVRDLRDAQYLYNRRKIIELDLLESRINSGYIYKENVLVDPRDVFLSGQGKGLAIKADANIADIIPIPAPEIPPSMLEVSALLAKEVTEISGVNEELLGSADDDKAGILSMLRQGAGLTTLQTLFDQLDRSQKILGGLMIEIIQNNFTPGKVKRIVEEEPTPEFFNKAFGTYDGAVEEGLNTTTQRQMQFAQLLHLKEAGVPISSQDLLESSTIQNKKEIIENTIKQQQAVEKAEAEQKQIEMQEISARTNLAKARAVADKGLGIERLSRVKENMALAEERKAEAKKDRTQSMLNFVKSLKELEDLDIAQMEKLITLSHAVEDREQQIHPATTVVPVQDQAQGGLGSNLDALGS